MSTDSDSLYQEVVEKYAEYVNPWLARLMAFAGFGVEMVGDGCWITDHEGRRYLDCLGSYGVFIAGHRHPKIVAAVKDQLDRMPISGKAFFSRAQADLAQKLASLAPGDLQYTFFSNSGAEAVEAALKFAKCATRRTKIVATNGGFHGKTIGALSVTGKFKYREPFEPLLPGVVFVDFGDAEAAASAIDDQTAAMIVEPIQGEGGIHVPPDGYLRSLRDACTRSGALLIMDEVQTGVGRTGKMFGSDWEQVEPDIMALAKGLGGGVMPIGATMGTPEVWEKVFGLNPLLHSSTFGGNPLACTAALAVLDVLESDGLLEKSLVRGERLLNGLKRVQERFPDTLKEVRGRGLMIGVEFTRDEVGELTIAQMMKRGLCAAYTLNNPRVIRFEPPLIIEEPQIDFAIEAFGDALAETRDLLAEIE